MNSFAEVFKTILSVLKWWATVTPWEQGVRVRAGRYVKHMGPGVHLCIPFLDRAYVQTTRARVMTVPTQTVTTKDGKTVTIGATIGFEIVDVPKLYATIHDVTGTIVSSSRRTTLFRPFEASCHRLDRMTSSRRCVNRSCGWPMRSQPFRE